MWQYEQGSGKPKWKGSMISTNAQVEEGGNLGMLKASQPL
jgi:hypothetical protein